MQSSFFRDLRKGVRLVGQLLTIHTWGDMRMEQRAWGGNGEMAATAPELRESALAFTEGVRVGWISSDLRRWIDDHLVVPGRLALRKPNVIRVTEPGAGAVVLEHAGHSARTRTETGIQTVALLAAARERVVQTLRSSLESGEARYVNAALYSGRVSRERGADGRSSWYVFLSDDVPLSDQVLAMFAADALTHPDQYQGDLCVCDECGAVSFIRATESHRGCAIHPFGSLEASKPPSSASGARRILDRT